MRDLLYKNLTSSDRRRKKIASLEVVEQQGVRNTIRRHFIYLVKEVKGAQAQRPLPSIHIIKERNTREQRESFSCRIKGSMYAVHKGKLYLILFVHSLKITLVAVPQGSCKENA